MLRLLYGPDLRDRGIKYSRQHLERLIKARKFPAPVKPGAGTAGAGTGANAWIEHEIDAYIEGLIAARDAIPLPTPAEREIDAPIESRSAAAPIEDIGAVDQKRSSSRPKPISCADSIDQKRKRVRSG